VAYNTTDNAERVFTLLEQLAHDAERGVGGGAGPVTLMESYNCPTEDVIGSGDPIPYLDCLRSDGLQKAVFGIKMEKFRERMSGELVAVLQSLRLRVPVRFCDRSHATSVDRIVARYTIQDLEHRSAEALNRAVEEATARQVPVVLAQNAVGPSFPELQEEREQVMAHCARHATDTGPALVVVGGQHVAAVMERMDAECDVDDLLTAQPTPSDTLEVVLRKRALLLALFITTSAFPGDAVVGGLPDLSDQQTDEFRGRYSAYRTIFQRRLITSAMGKEQAMRVMQHGLDCQGLPQLLRLLDELGAVDPAAQPPDK